MNHRVAFFGVYLHFKGFVPVRVDGLLDDGCRVRLFAIDRHHSERIWETEQVALVQTIGWRRVSSFPVRLALVPAVAHTCDDRESDLPAV